MHMRDVAGYLRQADQIAIILGAGASITAGIPKADTLIKQVNEEYGHCLSGLTDEERKDYGKVMRTLGDVSEALDELEACRKDETLPSKFI